MSSRREVFIRILALLQGRTLIETKNRTLKCLKRHYSTVRSMKKIAVLTEDGAFALFFRPQPKGFDSPGVPTPGNLPSKAKIMLMHGGQPGGGGARRSWNWLMHNTDSDFLRLFMCTVKTWKRWNISLINGLVSMDTSRAVNVKAWTVCP